MWGPAWRIKSSTVSLRRPRAHYPTKPSLPALYVYDNDDDNDMIMMIMAMVMMIDDDDDDDNDKFNG